MAKLLKLRRGTTAQHASFTGAEGEVTIDTTKDTAVIHDGSTAGGTPLAKQNMSNVPAGTIVGTQLENSGVTGGQYGSSSAIPIITVDNQGLVTSASTTAIDSTTIANGTSNVAVANNGDITTTRSGTARLVVDSEGVDVTGHLRATSGNLITDYAVYLNNSNGTVFFGADTGGFGTIAGIGIAGNNNYHVTGSVQDDLVISAKGSKGIVFGTKSTSGAGATSERARIKADGTFDITGNLDVGAGVDVTGNITCTGTVDGVDVAARNTLFGGLTSSSGVLTNGVTATTQAQSDNSTKVSTTAYVRTAISEAQAFPSGTKMLFQQTSAPTGWTKVTSGVDNKALRVVSGTAGSGGSNAFSNTLASRNISASAGNTTQGGNVSVANTTAGGNVNISSVSTGGTVNSHTLTVNEIPSHNHGTGLQTFRGYNTNYTNNAAGLTGSFINAGTRGWTHGGNANWNNTGGGGGHSHGFTGGSHNHNGSLSGTAHNHNASFTGSAHNHSISVTNLDMAVQYLDVIIAAKD